MRKCCCHRRMFTVCNNLLYLHLNKCLPCCFPLHFTRKKKEKNSQQQWLDSDDSVISFPVLEKYPLAHTKQCLLCFWLQQQLCVYNKWMKSSMAATNTSWNTNLCEEKTKQNKTENILAPQYFVLFGDLLA